MRDKLKADEMGRCPKCDSGNVERISVVDTRENFDGAKFFCEAHCHVCEFNWKESR